MNSRCLTIFGVFVLSACAPNIYKKFYIPNKAEITAKNTNCVEYKSLINHNLFHECIYEEVRCIDKVRGAYCAYSQCPNSTEKDTVRYIEFRYNPIYKYRKNALCSDMKKEDYLYIADGKCILNEWHSERCNTTPTVTIFLEKEPNYTELHYTNSTVGVCGWGDRKYWSYGRQEGTYKDGRRIGKWTFSAYSDPFFVKKENFIPLLYKQVSIYDNGLKNGPTTYLYTSDSSQTNPLQWKDTLLVVPYQDGLINGWVLKRNKENASIDSTYYKNDKKIN